MPLFHGAGVIVCGDDEPMPVVLLGGVTVREAVFVCTQTFSAKVNLQLPRDVPTTVVIIAALGWSKRTWHEPPAERYQFSPAIALETTCNSDPRPATAKITMASRPQNPNK